MAQIVIYKLNVTQSIQIIVLLGGKKFRFQCQGIIQEAGCLAAVGEYFISLKRGERIAKTVQLEIVEDSKIIFHGPS